MRRAMGVVAAVASVALISACASPYSTPIPPTDAEALEFAQEMLDGTHAALGIGGNSIPAASELLDYDSWNNAIQACLSEAEVENTSVTWTDTAFELTTYDRLSSAAGENHSLYLCVAIYSLDFRTTGALYSSSQREYLWSYYQRWTMPCLSTKHIDVEYMPSRSDFMAQRLYVWTPYDSVDYLTLIARLSYYDREDPYSALTMLCGAPYGVIAR